MSSLLLSVIATATLPTPHFAPKLPLPTPRFTKPIPVAAPRIIRKVDRTIQFDSQGRLVRLSGPRNWYRCPQCGSSTDLMYLGQHLRGAHHVTNATINKVGWRNLLVYHDNLHNVTWRPPPATKPRAVQASPVCPSNTCRFPAVRRFLGGG
jgi:hypothetical protein